MRGDVERGEGKEDGREAVDEALRGMYCFTVVLNPALGKWGLGICV